jgi:predicted nucleic acid-binding Zn ribbon protein
VPGDSPAAGGPGGSAPRDSTVDRAALAAQALEKAKADARARGSRASASATGQFSKRKNSASSPARLGQPSGRARRDDPAPLDAAIGGLIAEAGWELAVATGSVFGRWAQIVGPELAAHTVPERLDDGVLIVAADSTAWATQLRLLAGELVRRLNGELGDGTVRRVQVRGPGSGARRSGQWRVKGSRGDRDTYG